MSPCVMSKTVIHEGMLSVCDAYIHEQNEYKVEETYKYQLIIDTKILTTIFVVATNGLEPPL